MELDGPGMRRLIILYYTFDVISYCAISFGNVASHIIVAVFSTHVVNSILSRPLTINNVVPTWLPVGSCEFRNCCVTKLRDHRKVNKGEI